MEETDTGSDPIQAVFEHAVKYHLPSAFVSLLERVDEFQLGKVLVLHKKPRFWRCKELDFTSIPLTALLDGAPNEGGKPLSIQQDSKKLFDQSCEASKRVVQVDLDVDAELKTAWFNLNSGMKGRGTRLVNLFVDFGTIDHIFTDTYQALAGQQWRLDMSNSVVKDAIAKGKEMYVITSVYQAEKSFVRISESLNINVGQSGLQPTCDTALDETDNSGEENKGLAEMKQFVRRSTSSEGQEREESGVLHGCDPQSKEISVCSRDLPTVIAFHVLKLTIGRGGVLIAHTKTGFEHPDHIHDTYGDSYVSVGVEDVPPHGCSPTSN